MKKLTKADIQFIDNYLIKTKIKYIDVRLELIDHLAAGFEENLADVSLEVFLISKRDFIDLFVKKRQKTIHWSYQKQLWKRFFKFFYQPKYIIATLFLAVTINYSVFELKENISKNLFIFSLVILNITPYFFYFKQNKVFKKIQSAKPILAIMAFPSLFLYIISPIKDFLFFDNYILISYWFLGVLFNIAGLLEVFKRKKEILKKHTMLITN